MLGVPAARLHPEMERVLRRHQAALLQWNAGRVWDEQQPALLAVMKERAYAPL